MPRRLDPGLRPPAIPRDAGGPLLLPRRALQISEKSIDLTDNVYRKLSDFSLDIGRAHLTFSGAVFLVVLIIAIYIARFRPFGRYVYAIGGNEQSASLMGLPVNRTKIWIYGLSGLYAAFAGVLYTADLSAGNAIAATGLELDAIAAVVVGGTLLSGGVGFVAGTFIGILIFGVIQTGISFQGNIPSAMTKVVIGGLPSPSSCSRNSSSGKLHRKEPTCFVIRFSFPSALSD